MILRTNLSSLRAAVFYPLIVVFAAVQMASGVDRSTYTTVNGAGVTPATLHKSWMSALPDAMLISELSIPGTHDAGCIDQYGDVSSHIADCQDAKIIDQLNAGVRFLDLRVEDSNGPWEIFHDAYQYQPLWDVLTEIATFLNDHPRETVLTRITVFQSDHEAFLFQWPWMFGGAFEDFIWQQKDQFRADGVTPTTYAHEATGDPDKDQTFGNQSYVWPTLGEVRGKMVLFFGRADPLLNEGRGHASGLGYVGHYPSTTLASSRTSEAGIVVGVTRDQYDNANTDNKWEGDEIIINAASADLTKETLYTTGINIGATAFILLCINNSESGGCGSFR
jgi:hypothetical protein